MRILYRFLSSLLTGVVLLQTPLGAQDPPPSAAAFQDLHLAVAGDAAVTFAAGALSEHTITIEVTGPNGAPAPSVTVTFRLPEDGATGSFADGGRVSFVSTDSEGRAAAPSIQWGPTPGTVALRVTAAKGIAHAGLLVERTLTAAAVPAAPPPAAAVPAAVTAAVPSAVPAVVSASPAPSRPHVSIVNRMQPGTLADASGAPANPNRADAAAAERSTRRADVSVVNNPKAYASPHSSKKWLWIALIAGGAAGGAALALAHGSSPAAASAATQSLLVGTPTISVGHP